MPVDEFNSIRRQTFQKRMSLRMASNARRDLKEAAWICLPFVRSLRRSISLCYPRWIGRWAVCRTTDSPSAGLLIYSDDRYAQCLPNVSERWPALALIRKKKFAKTLLEFGRQRISKGQNSIDFFGNLYFCVCSLRANNINWCFLWFSHWALVCVFLQFDHSKSDSNFVDSLAEFRFAMRCANAKALAHLATN